MDIELGNAVVALRDQLLDAASRDAGQDVRFLVGPIELSFEVELRADAKAKTGFKAWVVSGDVEAGGSRVRRQRVTMTLTPEKRGGGDVLVGDDARESGPGDVSRHVGR
ncbi:trypco2 family protein [Nocardia sp. NPDC052278]|uniref:trypco2 family protein n=1 Tax=unclassified Nocardia TaxID=2637762 RepID=UPI00367754E1